MSVRPRQSCMSGSTLDVHVSMTYEHALWTRTHKHGQRHRHVHRHVHGHGQGNGHGLDHGNDHPDINGHIYVEVFKKTSQTNAFFPVKSGEYCKGRCGGGVRGPWGNGGHLGSQGRRGIRPTRMGKGRKVGMGQWRRIDSTKCLRIQETGSPQHQATFMHRVCIIAQSMYRALCVNYHINNHNRNHVLLYYLFQENKSFGSKNHLHSSSGVREVVSSTSTEYNVDHCIQTPRSRQDSPLYIFVFIIAVHHRALQTMFNKKTNPILISPKQP
jgi:hypothetical protein